MRSILILSLLFLCACSGNPNAKEKIYPVQIDEAIARDTPIFIDAIGNVYTLQFVQIRPQVGGIVLEAYVKDGQYVKKGDPLYKIDPRPYQAALDKAKAALIKDKAALQFNETRVKRYSELTKDEYFSKLNFEQYQSELETVKGQIISDQADIDTAQLNLEWATPVSPLDGKISENTINPGNLVVPNNAAFLTDIRQITPAEIRFSINQNEFIEVQKAVKKGALKFYAFLPGDEKNPREGEIYFIDNHINQETGTILLKGTVQNEDELFWPGEFVRIRLQLRIEPQAVLVPRDAIRIGQEGHFLYVYNPTTSTVEYRRIVKGNSFENFDLIEKGVKAGEKVVVKGQINLKPGVKVSLYPAEKVPSRL